VEIGRDIAYSAKPAIGGQGGETLFFFRRKKRFEVVSGIVAGKEVTYSFTRPVPEERAQREFKAAAEKRLPSGSVIIIP